MSVRGHGVLVATAVGFSARLTVALGTPVVLERDALVYLELAKSLLGGEGFARGGVPSIERPPGYPAFLALILGATDAPLAVRLVQVVLGTLTIPLVARLTAAATTSLRAPVLAAWVAALFPDLIVYPSLLLAETLWLFLFLASTALIVRAPPRASHVVGAGCLLGAALLVRSVTLVHLAAWLTLELVLAWRQPDGMSRVRRVLAASLVALVVITPWVVRTSRLAERLVLVDVSADFALRLGHQPGSLGDKAPLVMPPGEIDDTRAPLAQRALLHRRWALEEIARDPRAAVMRTFLKGARFLHPRGDLELLEASWLPRRTLALILSTLATELVLLLAIVGFARVRLAPRWAPCLAAIAACLAVALVFHFDARYRQAALVFAFMPAALAFDTTSRLSPRVLSYGLALHAGALAVATWIDLPRYLARF